MATGDIIFFDEGLLEAFFTGWASADVTKLALLDNTTTPVVGAATPALSTYTEVTAAGTYTAGGTSLNAWGTNAAEAAGTVTWDSTVNPTWAADGSNDVDAWWGLLYNDTDAANAAFAFVELGGPVDMQAVTLTITWNVSGIFSIAAA